MTQTHPRGAELVDLVIAHVRSGASSLQIHEPRPLAPDVIEALRFPTGAPLPPSLRRWLAFDASWLVRRIELFSSLEDPRLETASLSQLAARQWHWQADPVRAVFAELEAVLPAPGAFLDLGCDSFRLLYNGAPDDSGEYPVLCLDIDDVPLAALETAGFDLWLAAMAGFPCDEEALAGDLAACRRRLFGDADHFEMMGAWTPVDEDGQPVGALPLGDPDDESYFDDLGMFAGVATAAAEDQTGEWSPAPASAEGDEDDEENAEDEEADEGCAAEVEPPTEEARAAGRLVEAIELGDRARIRAGLADNRDRFPHGPWRARAVIAALYRFDDEILAEVLAAGGDPDAHGPYGRALTLVARMGSAGKVRLLLAAGADALAADEDGDLPLNQAAGEGYREVAAILLDAGASPRAEDQNGRAALLEAAHSGHHDLVALLLERGADPGQGQESNCAPIHCAVEHGRGDTVDLLLTRGACPDARNWCGDTALHIAFKLDHADVARRLLACGARRDIANQDGWTVDSLIDGRGAARREVSVTYRASAQLQQVVIEVELLSWDRSHLAPELPQRLTGALAPLVAVAAAGGLGADRFDPSDACAELTVAPSSTLVPLVARHTMRWQLEVAGLAPAGLALLLAPLALQPLGDTRILRLTVAGSLPLDNTDDTVVIAGPDATARIAALAAELRPWPAPPFAVEDEVAARAEVELTFAGAPARATSAAIDELLRGWSLALPALPPREGEPASRFVLVQARKPKGATQRWVIQNPMADQVGGEFPFRREAALAIAIGVLAGAAARGADLRGVRLALPR